MRMILFLCLTFWISHASAFGSWFWAPDKIEERLGSGFAPEFIISRAARFDSNGKIEPLFKDLWQIACDKKPGSSAWVIYRLRKGEELSPSFGRSLARNLNQEFKGTCFKRIELNIESILKPKPWFIKFLKATRENLSSDFKLDVTVEPPSSVPPLPNFTEWTKADLEAILQVVDGIDVMNYESAHKTSAGYQEMIAESAKILLDLLKTHPEKQIRFGVPTYQDKTQWHDPEIENLGNTLKGLKKLQAEQQRALCSANFQIVYFEGAGMTGQDNKSSQQLSEWVTQTCKN